LTGVSWERFPNGGGAVALTTDSAERAIRRAKQINGASVFVNRKQLTAKESLFQEQKE
jgi:hypothetical protein